MRSTLRRATVQGCVAALVCSLSAAQSGDSAADPAESPLAQVEFTPQPLISGVEFIFGGDAYSNVLPFDQYFTIYGQAPAGTTKIEASYLERKRGVGVRRTDQDVQCLDPAKRRAKRSNDSDWSKVHCDWISMGLAELDCRKPPPPPTNQPVRGGTPAAETGTVYFCYPQAGPLKANRHYLYRFDFPTEIPVATLEKFRKDATDLIEEEFKTLDKEVEADQFRRLGTTLFRKLKELSGQAKLDLRDRDGYFTENGFRSGALKDFNELEALSLLQDVVDIKDGIESWSSRSADFMTHLGQLKSALDAVPGLEVPLSDVVRSQLDLHPAERFLDLASPADEMATGLKAVGDKTPTTVLRAYADKPATMPLDVAEAASAHFTELADPGEAGPFRQLSKFLAQLPDIQGDDGEPLLSAEDLERLAGDEPKREGSFGGLILTLIEDADGLKLATERVVEAIDQRRQDAAGVWDSIADTIVVEAQRQFRLVAATTSGDFRTRQQFYLSADIGLAGASELDEVLRFVAMNIYLRPVNRQASFADADSFLRRFALTIGVTEGSVGGDGGNDDVEDLFGSTSLLVGAGYRITEAIRLGAGAVVFKERDPNPLIDSTSLTYTPYVSISFDWDIRRTFEGWFNFPSPES